MSKEEDHEPSSTYYGKEMDKLPDHTVVRERFASKMERRLTYLASIVGPSKVWRFPVLVFKYRAAFVVAYIAINILVGVPISLVEYSLGQYSGKNNVRVWDMIPAFRGLGFSMCLLTFLISVHYHVFMAESLLYAIKAFNHTLPWTICKPEWTNCFSEFQRIPNLTVCNDSSGPDDDCFCSALLSQRDNCRPFPMHASELFYLADVLNIPTNDTESHNNLRPSWDLSIVLLVSILVFTVFIIKGIRSTVKFMFLPVLLPMVGLLLLAIKAGFQTGATSGLTCLFSISGDDWRKLFDPQLWLNAVGHTLLSLSASLGILIMLGSYNHFDNRPDGTILLLILLDIMTNILASMVIFFTIGHSAYVAGQSISSLHHSGLNMVFTVIPTTFAHFSEPHVWSVIFFVMLFSFCLDPQFCFFEMIMAYLQDDFRVVRRQPTLFRLLLSILTLLAANILITPYFHNLLYTFDLVTIIICLPLVSFMEIAAIMWGYGFSRFLSDMEYMVNFNFKTIAPFLCVLYTCLVPVILLVICIFGIFVDNSVWTSSLHYIHAWPFTMSVGIVCVILSPIVLWLFLYFWRVCLSPRRRRPALKQPLSRWGPNDGTQIRRLRNMDTVFADIFPSLKRRIPKARDAHWKTCNYTEGFKMSFNPSIVESPRLFSDAWKQQKSVNDQMLDLNLHKDSPDVERQKGRQKKPSVVLNVPNDRPAESIVPCTEI